MTVTRRGRVALLAVGAVLGFLSGPLGVVWL